MQRNVNMLKNLKKLRFCRLYGFLCKNAVPSLSPERTFVLWRNFVIHYIPSTYKTTNGRKKNILHRKVKNINFSLRHKHSPTAIFFTTLDIFLLNKLIE